MKKLNRDDVIVFVLLLTIMVTAGLLLAKEIAEMRGVL
jgi:hypothetical protein